MNSKPNSSNHSISTHETEDETIIIDDDTLTQWVDDCLSLPHKERINDLAQKGASLRHYKEDIDIIRHCLNQSFHSDILAPADTALRVISSIKKEEAATSLDTNFIKDNENKSSAPVSPIIETTESDFKIDFEKLTPQKKHRSRLLSLAALLILTLIAGVFIHTEMVSQTKISTSSESENFPLTNFSAYIDQSMSTPHITSEQNLELPQQYTMWQISYDKEAPAKDIAKESEQKSNPSQKEKTSPPQEKLDSTHNFK